MERFYFLDVEEETLNDSVIDNIINYLNEEHELTNYLNSLEKID